MSFWKRCLIAVLALVPVESIAFAANVAQHAGSLTTDEDGERHDSRMSESMGGGR
jgi:hypothetical protein